LWVFSPPHFFAPEKMLRIFSLSGAKKRRLPPERYTPFVLNLVGKFYKNNIYLK